MSTRRDAHVNAVVIAALEYRINRQLGSGRREHDAYASEFAGGRTAYAGEAVGCYLIAAVLQRTHPRVHLRLRQPQRRQLIGQDLRVV